MKPVAIFRHHPTEGPGYFATYLSRCGRPWQLIRIDAGEPVPSDPSSFGGIALMGGPMSVNDPLPWIAPITELIRSCVSADVPVIGHCLGGQLMAKAMGGNVTRHHCKEIGWGEVRAAESVVARRWFGAEGRFEVFHWHGDTFSLPAGATHLLASDFCENQAFALGKHIGMQCHIEMTCELIESWCVSGADEIAASSGQAVQRPEEIQRDLAGRLSRLHGIADHVYAHWVAGLAR